MADCVKIMDKRSWTWGIASCFILGIISLFLVAQYPCNSNFPVGICVSGLFFVIINFFGLLILQLLSGGNTVTIEQVSVGGYIAIVISLPIYFLVGILIKFIYEKLRN